MSTYRFYEDPGHGWLEVPIVELQVLGIAKDVSPFSYRNGVHAYLEEDVDMMLFVGAKRARGEAFDYTTRHDDPSPVRRYARYV